jgi:SAM-dependent methyltransferase
MRAQRPPDAATAIDARAEALPFEDGSFDAAMAVLTVHHWDDPAAGLREMRRVARRAVVLTFDPAEADAFWLVRDYLPEIAELDRGRFMRIDDVVAALDPVEASVERVPIPHDCSDGFLGAFWRRPERYLDQDLLPGSSALMDIDRTALERGLAKLANDLEAGAWKRRYGGLLSRHELDLGYRLVIAELAG